MIQKISKGIERFRFVKGLLRGLFIGTLLKSKKGKLIILDRCTILCPFNMTFGKNIFINENCTLEASGNLTIGDNVIIGTGTQIWTLNHNFNDIHTPIRSQGFNTKPVVIQDDVWIAAGCIILAGVTIGKGSIIGAGSIVTKDIPSYSIACGNPAKVIKHR